MYDAPNAVGELKQPRKHPTVEKVEGAYHKNSGTLIFLHICLFADQYFIWLKKRRADFILNCLIDTIKSVHFAIIDLKRKIEYNIVKCPIISLIKGD